MLILEIEDWKYIFKPHKFINKYKSYIYTHTHTLFFIFFAVYNIYLAYIWNVFWKEMFLAVSKVQ